MNDYIGILLIIMLAVISFQFAELIAGQKKGDKQIIQKLINDLRETRERLENETLDN